jgi:hypothetical protein
MADVMSQNGTSDLVAAHTRCVSNKEEILASSKCACFYCLEIFAPTAIDQWIRGEDTALCPGCGIDSQIGDKSGYPISDPAFLKRMRRYWFEKVVRISN